ncbi:MAG TPA: dihydroneopterin aldolase [Acidimicrobiales bacterium]|nr:dihydroneopterin aldolase [Acidimicrobiales bacterium]
MTDAIEIRGLRVLGVHGVLASEREQPQPFELDLTVDADLAPAALADDLGATVDYGRLAAVASRVVAQESFQLLETLADRVASAVLAHDARVDAVTVVLRKSRPPLPVDLSSVGVRITRRRAAPGAAAALG